MLSTTPSTPVREALLRRHARAAGLCLVVVIGGCAAVGPDFKPIDVQAPPRWADRHGGSPALGAPASAASAPPADRWAVFGDQELQRLQARALQANQDIRIGVLRLMEARVQETMVSAQHGLQAAAQGGVTRERQSEYGGASRLINAIGGSGASPLRSALSAPFTLYQAGFDASWEPDLWGRVLRSEEVARADSQGQEAALRQVHLGVVAEVARLYFTLRSARLQEQLAQEQLGVARETEGLLQAQYGNGIADDSALLRQRTRVASLRAALPSLQAEQASAMNGIALLVGASPGELNDELSSTRMSLGDVVLPDLRLGLPGEFVRHRPDIRVAESRLHSATANIGVAVADLYPRVILGADFGLESAGSAKFADWGSRQWSVGPSLSLPLWDHGRRRSTVALRELQQQEAAVAFQQSVLAAWREVDDAISAYRAESLRDGELSERVRNSAEDVLLSQARYDGGLTDFLGVLSARAILLDARRDGVDGKAHLYLSLAALYKALGDDDSLPVESQ